MSTPMRITFSAYDELVQLSQLKKSKFQRNIHPPEQIDRLALNMRELGVNQAIHVSKRSGEVSFGHGRWAAALKNGWEVFPVVYQDFASDEEEYLSVQADNSLNQWSELDLSKINEDLENMGPFQVELLGIQNFMVDPAEKEESQKGAQEYICPHCSATFYLNECEKA